MSFKPKPKYVRLVDGLELMSHVVVDKTKPQFLFLLQPHKMVQMEEVVTGNNEIRGRVGLQAWPHYSSNEQIPVRVEAVAVVSELTSEFCDFYASAITKGEIPNPQVEAPKPTHPGDPDAKEEPDAFKDFVIDFTKLN